MFGKKTRETLKKKQDANQKNKTQPDRLRDQPGDTFLDIIIFLLILALITGLVFFYWAFSL